MQGRLWSAHKGRTELQMYPNPLLTAAAIAIHSVQVPTSCTGVPSNLLQPQLLWQEPQLYSKTLEHLAHLFTENFSSLVASSSSSGVDSRSRELAGSGLMAATAAGGPQMPESERQCRPAMPTAGANTSASIHSGTKAAAGAEAEGAEEAGGPEDVGVSAPTTPTAAAAAVGARTSAAC